MLTMTPERARAITAADALCQQERPGDVDGDLSLPEVAWVVLEWLELALGLGRPRGGVHRGVVDQHVDATEPRDGAHRPSARCPVPGSGRRRVPVVSVPVVRRISSARHSQRRLVDVGHDDRGARPRELVHSIPGRACRWRPSR